MRPVLLAGLVSHQPPLTYSPAPGTYSDTETGNATYSLSASAPVVWNWSSAGNLPTADVPNGGVSESIQFTLGASRTVDKSCTINVSSNGQTWTINLTALHQSGVGGPTP